jgi:hypothetical protein
MKKSIAVVVLLMIVSVTALWANENQIGIGISGLGTDITYLNFGYNRVSEYGHGFGINIGVGWGDKNDSKTTDFLLGGSYIYRKNNFLFSLPLQLEFGNIKYDEKKTDDIFGFGFGATVGCKLGNIIVPFIGLGFAFGNDKATNYALDVISYTVGANVTELAMDIFVTSLKLGFDIQIEQFILGLGLNLSLFGNTKTIMSISGYGTETIKENYSMSDFENPVSFGISIAYRF